MTCQSLAIVVTRKTCFTFQFEAFSSSVVGGRGRMSLASLGDLDDELPVDDDVRREVVVDADKHASQDDVDDSGNLVEASFILEGSWFLGGASVVFVELWWVVHHML